MMLVDSARTVGLANGHVVAVTRKTVDLQLTVNTSSGPVVLDPELNAVMTGRHTVCIVGRATLDKLGLNLNTQTSQLVRA